MAATDELRDAVAKACHSEAETRDGEIIRDLLLAEFVVVACRQGWDAEGEPVTQVFVIPADGPEHRILGLLRTAVLRFEADELN